MLWALFSEHLNQCLSHTFVDIDHEIISTVIQEGLLSVTSESCFFFRLGKKILSLVTDK